MNDERKNRKAKNEKINQATNHVLVVSAAESAVDAAKIILRERETGFALALAALKQSIAAYAHTETTLDAVRINQQSQPYGLIESALDMLSALKLALQALDEGREYQGEILEVMDTIRDAIEKAEVYL